MARFIRNDPFIHFMFLLISAVFTKSCSSHYSPCHRDFSSHSLRKRFAGPMDHTESRKGDGSQSTSSWTIDVSDITTVKVSNVSIAASERDVLEFFSFSGDIQYIEMQRETETTRTAYVAFGDSQGAETAILLTGGKIVGLSVSITPAENYQLPPNAPLTSESKLTTTSSAIEKAEDVVSRMLAKGFVLRKDALTIVKSIDEKLHLTLNDSATVSSIDTKIGLTKKLSMGAAVVNEKVKQMEEWFQAFQITKSAFAVAEDKASGAGSAIMSNRYVSTGTSWVTNVLSAVSKAAEDVSAMTKEKVERMALA